MKSSSNPNTIYKKILSNDIATIEGIDILISFVEKSENTRLRLESLTILHKMKAQGENIFKTLENCLISDEREEIRIMSAKFILEQYVQTGEECLKWAILNDKSSRFLKTIQKLLNDQELDRYEAFYKVYLQRIEKIAKNLELVTVEVPFLLDIEFNLGNYNSFNWSSSNKLLYDDDIIFRIQDLHILELSISLRDHIPSSIILLKNLKNLNLSCNNLTDLPNSFSDLKKLEIIDLSWNDFKLFPTVLNKLKSIKTINFQNNLIRK